MSTSVQRAFPFRPRIWKQEKAARPGLDLWFPRPCSSTASHADFISHVGFPTPWPTVKAEFLNVLLSPPIPCRPPAQRYQVRGGCGLADRATDVWKRAWTSFFRHSPPLKYKPVTRASGPSFSMFSPRLPRGHEFKTPDTPGESLSWSCHNSQAGRAIWPRNSSGEM